MIVCGLDFETNGLDPTTCLPVEVAWCIVEGGLTRPIDCGSTLLYDEEWGPEPLTPELTAIHGISNAHLRAHGFPPKAIFISLAARCVANGVQAIVAHNGNGFDRPIAKRFCEELGNMHWIDTRTDVPYPDGMSRKLVHLAAEHGFLNPFPHNGLADVLTMLQVLSEYDFETVLARSKSPSLLVRALVSFEEKEKAKAQRYFWERYGDDFVPKAWIKRVKECDLAAEKKACDFEIGVIAPGQ